MAPSAPDVVGTAPVSIETAQPQKKTALAEVLQRLGAASGRPLTALLGDFIRVSIGPGKLSFDEFVALGLYDPRRVPGVDIRSFVGLGAMQRIWRRANYRTEFDGLIANKIAMGALLQAHGFPVIPLVAMFSMTAGYPAERSLRTKEALRNFLSDPAHYPIFGKPVGGTQSLGAASFAHYNAAANALVGHTGSAQDLDRFTDDVAAHFPDGYMFQPHLAPHAATRAICGDRLATVRVVTIARAAGPEILRVCEKIPAGANAADNYWRPGNLLVQLDPQTGLRGRVTSGKGLELREHTHHPDSAAAISGTFVPNWDVVCELAKEAARLMKETGLMGWDIAPVDTGAVIVDANASPDLMLPQLADRRGILDAELLAFLEERARSEKTWKRALRATSVKQHRASFMN